MSATAAYALYLIFTLGGTAVYFMLPQGAPLRRGVVALFGLSALAALLVLFVMRAASGDPTRGYFYLFSTIALLASARVITHTRPVYSAVYFLLVIISVAAMLVLLNAEFVAVALIIIYAGAILVTYLFVIMLAQQPGLPIHDRRAREPFAAVLAGFVLTAAIASRASDLPKSATTRTTQVTAASSVSPYQEGIEGGPSTIALVQHIEGAPRPALGKGESRTRPLAAADHVSPRGNSVAVGEVVMTRQVITLQVAGILLLISMVGAIALSRRRVVSDSWQPPRPALGQIGKDVKPF